MSSFSYPSDTTVLNMAANSLRANLTGSSSAPLETTVTALPTASSVVIRDSNGNFATNLMGLKRNTTFTGPYTLTATSPFFQTITDASDMTVILPDVSTLPKIGFSFYINATSTGNITINTSGGNTICVLTGSGAVLVTCIALTGTGTASWQFCQMVGKAVTAATANNMMLYDSSGNVQVLNSVLSVEDIASVNGSVQLTLSSAAIQFVTGSTAGTIVNLPDTSTLSSSYIDSWKIINTSTQLVTLQSYDGTTLLILSPNAQAICSCVSTAANDATAWVLSYSQPNNVGYANKYSATTTVISSTPTVLVWNTGNITDSFTQSSGVFTAKYGGFVKVVISLAVTATFAKNDTVLIEILKNGTTIAQRTYYTIASITDVQTMCQTVTQIAAADTVSIRVSTTGTTPTLINSNSRNDVTLIYV